MLLHPDKTKFMVFNPLRNAQIKLQINNNNFGQSLNPNLCKDIECITGGTSKFLGVNFDSDLSFNLQITNVKSKISKSLFIIQRAKNVLSAKTLLTLYYSKIHCHLNCSLNIWSCAAKSNINQLTIIQKRAIRAISNSKYNDHTEPIFKKLNILPVHQLVKFSRLLFMHTFTNNRLRVCFANTWASNLERRGLDNFHHLIKKSR